MSVGERSVLACMGASHQRHIISAISLECPRLYGGISPA